MSILIKDVMLPWGRKASVSILGNRIVEVGKNIKGEHEHVLDGKGCLLVPGLVNAHTHIAMTGFRGIADDLPLQEWLEEHIWPAEKEKVNPDFVYWNSLLGIIEMLKSGTTGFVDMYFHENKTAEAVEKAGIRAWLGEGVADTFEPVEKTLAKVEQLMKTRTDYVNVIVSPHAVYTCSEETLAKTAEFAEEHDLLLQVHAAENKKEVKDSLEQTGMRPVEYLNEVGVLSPRTLIAHGVWVTDQEIQMISESGTSVAYNPESNAKLGSGVAPVREYIGKGVNVVLGTDGCASNNNLDMVQEMRTGLFMQKVVHHDPTALRAEEALALATHNAYNFLSLDVGLEEGKLSDLALISMKKPHMQPVHDAVSNLVYSGSGPDVIATIVNGRLVYDGKEVLGVDEQEVIEKVNGFWK